MTRRLLACALVIMVLAPGTVGARSTDAVPLRPNIVVLMLDDLPEMGTAMFDRLPTIKNLFLDRGLRFTNDFANDPQCCPGRAGFLTGLYSHHHGVTYNDGRLFDPSVTVATRLDDAGYYTFIAGKYFNYTERIVDKTPPGWDHTSISSGSYYDYDLYVDGVHGYHGSTAADYRTDVIRTDATQFLRMAPRDQPVFALLTPFAPHAAPDPLRPVDPRQAVPAPRHVGDPRCVGIPVRAGGAFNEADVSDKPAYVQALPLTPYRSGWPLRRACESLLAVDELLTAVIRELQVQGRYGDTLFVLTADNGMGWGDHRWPIKSVPYATHLPLLMRWKAGIGNVPGLIDEWTSMVDLAPTLVELAGAQPLGGYPDGQPAPDGLSLARLMETRGRTQLHRDALLEEHTRAVDSTSEDMVAHPAWYAIRTTGQSALGLWHYVEYDTGERELYDLVADPDELDNQAGRASYQAVQAALAVQLAALRSTNSGPAGPTADPAGAPITPS